MKKLTLLLVLLYSTFAHAQYFQRYFGNKLNPSKEHTFYDGICTKKNYSVEDTNFYNVAVGMAKLPLFSFGLTKYRELRFVRTDRNGTSVKVNRGYAFKDYTDSTSKWFNSTGLSLAEVDAASKDGGYIVVGKVETNALTGAMVAGSSDALISKIDNNGNVNMKYRIDFKNGGTDVLNNVIASTNGSTNVFYACGTSINPSNRNLIVIKFDEKGTILWGNTYRLDIMGSPTNTLCNGYGIAQNPASGELTVVGSIEDPDLLSDQHALVMQLTSAGTFISATAYDYNLFDEYRSIKWASTNEFIICGSYTDNAYTYTLAVKATAAGIPYLSKKVITGTPTINTGIKGYEIVERAGDDTCYYIVVNSISGTAGGGTGVIKTDMTCTPSAIYSYAEEGISGGAAIDLSELSDFSEGLRIFTNTVGASSPGKIDAFMIKAYFNGSTCTDYCPADSFQFNTAVPVSINIPNHESFSTKKKIKLTSLSTTYSSASVCSQVTVACGSNERAADVFDRQIENADFEIYPNPASQSTRINLNLSDDRTISICLLDLSGRKIKSVLNQDHLGAGNHAIDVNCSDLPSGIYQCVMMINNNPSHVKLIIQH